MYHISYVGFFQAWVFWNSEEVEVCRSEFRPEKGTSDYSKISISILVKILAEKKQFIHDSLKIKMHHEFH